MNAENEVEKNNTFTVLINIYGLGFLALREFKGKPGNAKMDDIF